MTLQDNITKIFAAKSSKKDKQAAVLSLIAEDRRDNLYRLLDLQKSQGSKWFGEEILKMARSDFGSEREDNEQ